MNAKNIAVVALALALAACAGVKADGPMVSAGNPKNPIVRVSAGMITVDQEVKRFKKHEKDFLITWTLDAPSGYKFPAKGIEFVDSNPGNEIVDCRKVSDTVFTCRNMHRKPGAYKYNVNVLDPQGAALTPLDPFILND
jgi:hypothetical protein